jgi:hypothetical protein
MPGLPQSRSRSGFGKTSKNLSHAFQQLASAVEQLDGITVGGRTPTGLAVSTVSADDQMRYLALDPTDEDEPSYEVGTEIMQEVDEFRFRDDVRNIPSQVLTSAWLRASWAMLADFGGNLEAVGRWAPEVVQRRRDRRTRQRVSYETPYGTARGTSVSFDFEGQLLTVKYGIEATLDRRLSGPTAEPVIEAQGAFAERLSVYRRAAEPTDPRELHSATTDGSIFSLTLK